MKEYKKEWVTCVEQYRRFKKLESCLTQLLREILLDYGSYPASQTLQANAEIKWLADLEAKLKMRIVDAILRDKELIGEEE